MSYNIKIFNYKDGKQVRIYENLQDTDNKNPPYNPLEDMEDDEIWQNIDKLYPYLKDGTLDKKRCDPDFIAYISRNRTKQNIYELVRMNKWDYFITLTLDPKKIDRYDYSAIQPKISSWLNNIKKRKCPDLKYIIVPELHNDGAYHFHGLFSNCDGLNFTDSGKRTDSGDIIYNINDYTLGFTSASKVKDSEKVRTYILKYITKELCAVTFGKKRYWTSKNLERVVTYTKTMDYFEKCDYEIELLKKAKYVKTVYCKVTESFIKYIEI